MTKSENSGKLSHPAGEESRASLLVGGRYVTLCEGAGPPAPSINPGYRTRLLQNLKVLGEQVEVYRIMTVYEIVIEGRQGANDMLNVFHYETVGTGDLDLDNLASVFYGHIDDELKQWASNIITWVGITVREDSPGAVGTFVPFPAGTITGTLTTADMAYTGCAFIKKLSGGLVKPTQGWWFQGGITFGGLSAAGTWESGVSSSLAAYGEAIRELSIADSVDLAMVIKARNPTAPNTQAYSTVNSIAIAGLPRNIRSRFPGSGS